MPDGAQSEPRHTSRSWRRAATTSVVSPYSQMFENGDQTIVPAPRLRQSANSLAPRAVEWIPIRFGWTQPAVRRSPYSSTSAGAVPSARWYTNDRPASSRGAYWRRASTSALITAWNTSCSLP